MSAGGNGLVNANRPVRVKGFTGAVSAAVRALRSVRISIEHCGRNDFAGFVPQQKREPAKAGMPDHEFEPLGAVIAHCDCRALRRRNAGVGVDLRVNGLGQRSTETAPAARSVRPIRLR